MKKILLSSALSLFLVACQHESASTLQVGSAAPAFTLPSQDDTDISLSQYLGKWVVLYFYPKDFSGGCTMEAHGFQQDIDIYHNMNAVIIGVSGDSVVSHKTFCTKQGLDFKLLADTSHTISDAYGTVMERNGESLSARSTFLIDPNGKLRKIYNDVNPVTHSQQVLADLKALQRK